MNTKYIHNIHSFSLFHWYPSPEKNCFTFLVLHFLKCILIVQRSFTLVFQSCIYHALTKLTPPPHYLLFLYHHLSPLIFNSLECVMVYYNHM
jgi:hypothetical protein